MGRTKVRDLVGSSYSSQVEQDERLNKMKSINEVEALKNIFHSFFEKGIQQNDTDDKVLISMQSPNHSMNPFFRYEKEKEEDDAELERSKSMNVSAVYAYATNLSGMFEHLNELNEKREMNPEWGHAYDTRNSMGGTRPNIELEKISENSRDETGLNDRQESCENIQIDDGFGLQKPIAHDGRRSTLASHISAQTEPNYFDFDESSDEDGDNLAPWVDHIKLRHGMDWLDLITNEVERDTVRINESIVRRSSAAHTDMRSSSAALNTDVRETTKGHSLRPSEKLMLNRPGLTNKRR